MGQASRLQLKAAEREQLCAVVRGAGGMVHAIDAIGPQRGYRVDVSCGEGSVAARRVRGRGVRPDPAPYGLLRHARRSRLAELLEAGERLGILLGVELLPARHAA